MALMGEVRTSPDFIDPKPDGSLLGCTLSAAQTDGKMDKCRDLEERRFGVLGFPAGAAEVHWRHGERRGLNTPGRAIELKKDAAWPKLVSNSEAIPV